MKRIDSLFAVTHTQKAARGSSYIPTPEKLAHPKCGLINIQNQDQECFRWCLLYHQSEQKEKSHRITALAKVVEKYDYSGITFPISYDQVEDFANTNELTINIWRIGEDKKTYLHWPGSGQHCRNGMVNLSLIKFSESTRPY